MVKSGHSHVSRSRNKSLKKLQVKHTNWKKKLLTNLGQNSVTIDKLGGTVTAPMKRTTLGCLSRLMMATWSDNTAPGEPQTESTSACNMKANFCWNLFTVETAGIENKSKLQFWSWYQQNPVYWGKQWTNMLIFRNVGVIYNLFIESILAYLSPELIQCLHLQVLI